MAQSDYSTVCPFITVQNIEMQIAFLVTVFNAAIKEQLRTPDGKTQFAEVKIGNTVLMINRTSDISKINPSANYVFVSDADEIFNIALLNGGTENLPSQTISFMESEKLVLPTIRPTLGG